MLKSPGAFGKGHCQRMPQELCPAGSSSLRPRVCSSGGSREMCGAWGEVGSPRNPGDVAGTVPRGRKASAAQLHRPGPELAPRFVPGQLSHALPAAPRILSHRLWHTRGRAWPLALGQGVRGHRLCHPKMSSAPLAWSLAEGRGSLGRPWRDARLPALWLPWRMAPISLHAHPAGTSVGVCWGHCQVPDTTQRCRSITSHNICNIPLPEVSQICAQSGSRSQG